MVFSARLMFELASRLRWCFLLLFGIGHALLYITLLPLWEGYDEPFHYAYVQHLTAGQGWPVADVSPFSEEIYRAWALTPVSPVWERKLPELTSYSEYFALPATEQRRRRLALGDLPAGLRQIAHGSNYEGQQPPLAYLLLAPIDRTMREMPLMSRVLVLRGCGALLAVIAYLAAFALLGRRMAIPESYTQTMAFCFLSLQNVFGSVAHIANDWLALPLIVLLFLAADAYWASPGRRRALVLGAVLAAGLLTKSYFLIFVPAALLVGWRHGFWIAVVAGFLAGPWYWRNVELYGSVSGLQEAVRPVSSAAMLAMARQMDWPGSVLGMARASLWTGNNSFVSYSMATLNVYLALVAGALGLWAAKVWQRGGSSGEWIVAGGTALFTIIPVYAMVLHGALNGEVSANANSWHTAGLLPGVFLLAAAGCGAWPRIGRWLAAGICLLSFYLLTTTYFVKLFPLYSGFSGSAGWASLRILYGDGGREMFSRLDRTALWGGASLGLAAGFLCVYAAVTCWWLCRRRRQSMSASESAPSIALPVSPAPKRTLDGR